MLTPCAVDSQTHPNEFSHARMKTQIVAMNQDLQRAWEIQYDKQKDLIKWPRGAFASAAVAGIFESFVPVEKYVPFPIEDATLTGDLAKITESDRRVYRDYIAPTFQNITKPIGTEWKAKLGVGGAAGGMGGPGMGPGDLVDKRRSWRAGRLGWWRRTRW